MIDCMTVKDICADRLLKEAVMAEEEKQVEKATAVLELDGKLLIIKLPDGTKITLSDDREAQPWKGGTKGCYSVIVAREGFKVSIGDEFLVFDQTNTSPQNRKIFELKN